MFNSRIDLMQAVTDASLKDQTAELSKLAGCQPEWATGEKLPGQ